MGRNLMAAALFFVAWLAVKALYMETLTVDLLWCAAVANVVFAMGKTRGGDDRC